LLAHPGLLILVAFSNSEVETMSQAKTKRTLSQTMALVEEMLQPSEDNSSLEELLEPSVRPFPVPFPQDTVKKKKKKKKNERGQCRRSKRLSPRRQLRPIKYAF
jgi:hypothetical protein